ncbi:radical SAM/SPASM domain-containing protein [Thermoclostridium stercorarium]|uniref:radical SAM/SPASM domain-containing protein n=1 Tax=Thermoclostridium stercorarium TaxID=1510 RepID=UPI001181C000
MEITTICNLACRTCYNVSTKPQIMTVEQFSRILADARQLVECLEMDGLWLTISGGEPLTNNWIWDMLQLAQGPDIKGIAIITNGTLINQETAKLMESLGISEVMISLDGASAQTHDAIRGQGSFARTMRGVEILIKYCSNIFLGCTMTLTTLNMDNTEDYVDLAFQMGFNYVWINPPIYCGCIVQSELDISYEEHLRIMKLVRELDTRYFRQAFAVYYNVPYYPLTDPISPYLDLSTACPWGRTNLTITADGSVLPCLYSRDLCLGNIFEQSLIVLYHSSVLEGVRNGSLLAEPCRSCLYREFCGGCRARTYYLTEDWFAADPWCPLVRGLTEEQIRVFPSNLPKEKVGGY